MIKGLLDRILLEVFRDIGASRKESWRCNPGRKQQFTTMSEVRIGEELTAPHHNQQSLKQISVSIVGTIKRRWDLNFQIKSTVMKFWTYWTTCLLHSEMRGSRRSSSLFLPYCSEPAHILLPMLFDDLHCHRGSSNPFAIDKAFEELSNCSLPRVWISIGNIQLGRNLCSILKLFDLFTLLRLSVERMYSSQHLTTLDFFLESAKLLSIQSGIVLFSVIRQSEYTGQALKGIMWSRQEASKITSPGPFCHNFNQKPKVDLKEFFFILQGSYVCQFRAQVAPDYY